MPHPVLASHLMELEQMSLPARVKVEEYRREIHRVQNDAREHKQGEAFDFALAIAYAEFVDRIALGRKETARVG